MDLEWARGTENEYHSISYSVDSVRLLRERLKDSQANISDQTLGAVAMMAAISVGFCIQVEIVTPLTSSELTVWSRKYEGCANACSRTQGNGETQRRAR